MQTNWEKLRERQEDEKRPKFIPNEFVYSLDEINAISFCFHSLFSIDFVQSDAGIWSALIASLAWTLYA